MAIEIDSSLVLLFVLEFLLIIIIFVLVIRYSNKKMVAIIAEVKESVERIDDALEKSEKKTEDKIQALEKEIKGFWNKEGDSKILNKIMIEDLKKHLKK